MGVVFLLSGIFFCVCLIEGLLIYSLDSIVQFDLFDFNMEIMFVLMLGVLQNEKDYFKVLVMVFCFNEVGLV